MNSYYAGPYELQFTKVNMRSPMRIYTASLLAVFFVAMLIINPFRGDVVGMSVFLAFMLLSAGIYFGFGLLVRVRIDDNGVGMKGLFGERRINWEEMADHGILLRGRYTNSRVNPAEADKFMLGGNKVLFVSNKAGYRPSGNEFLFGSNVILLFDYRKDAMALITYYFEKNKPGRSGRHS